MSKKSLILFLLIFPLHICPHSTLSFYTINTENISEIAKMRAELQCGVEKILLHDFGDLCSSKKIQIDKYGNYRLNLYYKHSLNNVAVVPFCISGKEIKSEIKIELANNKDSIIFWVSVLRIMPPHKKVSIKLKNGNIVGESPIFEIHNKSKQEIYGQFLPGYFWGKMLPFGSDPFPDRPGARIDFNFERKGPLRAGETAIATIGSFGRRKIDSPGKYAFFCYYSLNPGGFGYSVIRDSDKIKWNVKNRELYQLKSQFNVIN